MRWGISSKALRLSTRDEPSHQGCPGLLWALFMSRHQEKWLPSPGENSSWPSIWSKNPVSDSSSVYIIAKWHAEKSNIHSSSLPTCSEPVVQPSWQILLWNSLSGTYYRICTFSPQFTLIKAFHPTSYFIHPHNNTVRVWFFLHLTAEKLRFREGMLFA